MASKEFSSKLKNLRLKAGYSQKDVYEHFNIPQSTFSSWEVGKSEPSGEMLLKLCAFYKCDMMKEFSSEDSLTYKEWNVIEKYRDLDSSGQEFVDFVLDRETTRVQQLQKAEPTIIDLHSTTDGHLVSYYRSASAGSGVFILGNEGSKQITIPDTPENKMVDYAIGVSGTSMEPDYHDGDIVLVSQRIEMHPGDVGIFIINNDAYIKEYGETELISRNPDAPNIKIAEYDNIVCMGKVIGKL